MRPSSSSALRPLYCQSTAITGMLMEGKMSVGVRAMTTGLTMRIRSARTMNVYGRSRAIRTIHMTGYSTRLGGRLGRTLPACVHGARTHDVRFDPEAAAHAEAPDDLWHDDVDLHGAPRGVEPRGHRVRPDRHDRAAPWTGPRGVDGDLPAQPARHQRHRLRFPRRAPFALAQSRHRDAGGTRRGCARALCVSRPGRVEVRLRDRGGRRALPRRAGCGGPGLREGPCPPRPRAAPDRAALRRRAAHSLRRIRRADHLCRATLPTGRGALELIVRCRGASRCRAITPPSRGGAAPPRAKGAECPA